MKFTLSQNSWAGEAPVTITLPDDWQVEYLESPGDRMPALTKEELREAFQTAHGTKPLRELAKGKKSAVILFDDLTRATPTKEIAEIVVEILLEAGVPREGIRFICALGAHGALNRKDFCEKLGEDIVRDYAVYNHNPYENCVEIGTTKSGVPVQLNKEFLDCELKIGIGGFVPHPLNGFGGGGKIVMPGVASLTTIKGTHVAAQEANQKAGVNPLAGSGTLNNPAFRNEIEEIVRMCGFDFKIDAVINTKKEIIRLFVGDPIEEYYAAAEFGKEMYWVSPSQENQVVIVNANSKGSEASIAYFTALMALAPEGGDVVIVNHVPFGQATHYLYGAFGQEIGGQLWNGLSGRIPLARRLIMYSPYPDKTSAGWFCKPEELIWAEDWETVEELLAVHGAGTKAAVFADGTIQHIRKSGEK